MSADTSSTVTTQKVDSDGDPLTDSVSSVESESLRHSYNTRNSNKKKRKPNIDWDALSKSAKKRQIEENDRERQRNPINHLLSSIYADIDAAAKMQQRRAGPPGEQLTEAEVSQFERVEDIRLDRLRELRLLSEPDNNLHRLEDAYIARGRWYDDLRILREIARTTPAARRTMLRNLIEKLGWTLVTICLHSKSFCDRVSELTDMADVTKEVDAIKGESASYQFFAGTRSFDWLERTPEQRDQDALFGKLQYTLSGQNFREDEDHAQYNIAEVALDVTNWVGNCPGSRTEDPHVWKLSTKGGSAIRLQIGVGKSTIDQINIEESRMHPQARGWGNKTSWLIADEPRYRLQDEGPCLACKKEGTGDDSSWRPDCDCGISRLQSRLARKGEYLGDRVMLQDTKDMGTGVRALQCFPVGSILAEYVGEIYPFKGQGGKYKTSMYQMKQDRVLKGGKFTLCIDPAVRGNWTRYINHSCSPNTSFSRIICGNKQRMVIEVEQRIEFGAAITTNYERDYFVGQSLACLCGEDKCKLWNADEKAKNSTTLKKAKKEGIAPDWAKDPDNDSQSQ